MPAVDASTLEFCGNLFIRRVYFPETGDFMLGHRHAFDHVTFISQGAVRLRQRGTGEIIRDVVAPGFIPTPAEVEHDMIALAPDTCAWCVFALRSDAGDAMTADEAASLSEPLRHVR